MVLNIGLGDIDKARAIAKRAGQEILKVYNTAFAVAAKADDPNPLEQQTCCMQQFCCYTFPRTPTN